MVSPARVAMGAGVDAWWRPPPAPVDQAVEPAAEARAPVEGSIPFAGLLAFTVILLFSPQVYVPALAGLRIAFLAAAATAMTLLAGRFWRGHPLTIHSRHLTIALLLVAWSVATVPFSLWPGGSVRVLVELYAKAVVVFWLVANIVNTPARVRRLGWTLAILSLPIAATGLQNFVAGGFVKGTRVQRIVGYEAPLTANPNDLALMLNLLIPIMAALLLSRPSRRARWFLSLALVLNVAAVVVTFSRAGFLTLTTTALVYAWKLRRRPERRWILVAALLALVCVPFLPTGYLDRVATTVQIDADATGSAQARQADTWVALRYVAGHPIVGAGIGQDTLALNRERGPRWTAVHNVYLQHAVELGLPGLVLFAMLLAACLGSARRVEQAASARPEMRMLATMAAGIHVSLIAYAVAALFHPVSYHFYFYYVAGIAVALEAMARTSGLLAAPPRRPA